MEEGIRGEFFWKNNKAGLTKAGQTLRQTLEDDESTGHQGTSKKKEPAMSPTKAIQTLENDERTGSERLSKKEPAMSSTKAKQRLVLSQTPELEDDENIGNEGPTKKKRPSMTPKKNAKRRQTAPAASTAPASPPPSQSPILLSPGIAINSHGWTMYTTDYGNTYYSNI